MDKPLRPGMRERPILFSAPMVRAILAGQKTQTRRAVKGTIPEGAADAGVFLARGKPYDGEWQWLDSTDLEWASALGEPFRCPYGEPDDALWVKEAYRFAEGWNRTRPSEVERESARVYYEADQPLYHGIPRLRPSIHMPRWASRITLRITDVRIERLHDISEADALAEGIQRYSDGFHWEPNPEPSCCRLVGRDARRAYFGLWEAINGRESFAANPWLWVVNFERLS